MGIFCSLFKQTNNVTIFLNDNYIIKIYSIINYQYKNRYPFPIINDLIFGNNVLIELAGIQQSDNNENLNLIYIHSSQFIQDSLKNIQLRSMILQFRLQNDKDDILDLNPYKTLISFQLSNLQIISNIKKSKIIFNSYKYLIINDVQMNSQIIKSQYIFENIESIIINNFDLTKVNTQSELDSFLFKDIKTIVIRNITVNNSTFTSSTLMNFQNVSSIEIHNFTVSQNSINQGIISAFNIASFSLTNITVLHNSIKDTQQIKSQKDYLYILNLTYVEQIRITIAQIQNTTLGFINILGQIINLQKMNILSLSQIQFIDLETVIPLIKVGGLKQLKIIKLNAENIEYLNQSNFIQIEYSDEVEIEEFNIKNMINNRENNVRLLDSQYGEDNNNKFIFSLQGIEITKFSHSNFNNCLSGIFSLSTFQVQKHNFISSGSLEIQNVKVENSSIDIVQQSLFNFQNQQVKLANVNLTSITSQNYIINASQCEEIEIIDSTFLENKSQQNGGSIYISDVINVKINKSYFIRNTVKMSGGAVYLFKTKTIIISSIFDSNNSISEKGGAICSFNSYLTLQNTTIQKNKALIGGGIYHDSPKNSIIDKLSNLYNNQGFFYGNNIGSNPQYIKKIDPENNFTFDSIDMNNFQSGNYTNDKIYVQFFDEEHNFLKFQFNDGKKYNVSEAVQKEIQEYSMEINFDDESNVRIAFGKQLRRDSKHFQLNMTAYNRDQQEFTGLIKTNFQNVQLNVKLKFAKCEIGQIKQQIIFFIGCLYCQKGTYSLVDPNQYDETSCKKCPTEAFDCYAKTIILNDNYWKPTDLSDTIYSCPLNGCSELRDNKKGCIEGHIGPVCANCDYKGQYWNKKYGISGTNCRLCSELIFVYLFLAATIVFYTFYLNHSINAQIKQKSLIIKLNYLRKMDLLFLSKTLVSGANTTVLTKIFLHYVQILSVSLDFYSTPLIIKSTFSVAGDPSQVTFSSYDCMFSTSYIPQLWLNRLIVVFSQIVFTLLIILLYKKYIKRGKSKQVRISVYLIFIYFFYYPSITKLLISLSLCKEFGQKTYMQGDYLQECWTNDHIILSVVFIYPFTIIWSLGIPFMLLKKIQSAIIQKKSQSINYILSYYLIQQGYKEKYYYWEIVKMFQKFLIAIILNLTDSKLVQRILICLICFLYFSRLQKLKPYNFRQTMNIELLLSQIILFSLILTLITDAISYDSFIYILIMLVIAIINFYGLVKFIKIYFILTKAKLMRIQTSKLKTLLLKFKCFRSILGTSNVPILRTSFLWKKLRQNLSIYSKALTLNSQIRQQKLSRLTKSNDIIDNSYQDISMAFSTVANYPIVSAVAFATQEKTFLQDTTKFK